MGFWIPKLKGRTLLCLIGLLCLFTNTSDVFSAEPSLTIIENGILNNNLVMRFKAENLFNERVIKFLNMSFTVRFEYNIQLWRSRSRWLDHLESQRSVSYEVTFDPIRKLYNCVRYEDNIKLEVKPITQVEHVIQWTTTLQSPVVITELSNLDDSSEYYYNIDVLLSTLTAEDIRALQNWVSQLGRSKGQSLLSRASFKIAADLISSRNSKRFSMRLGKFLPKNLPKLSR